MIYYQMNNCTSDSWDSTRFLKILEMQFFNLGGGRRKCGFERLKRQWLRWLVINEGKTHLQIPPLLLLLVDVADGGGKWDLLFIGSDKSSAILFLGRRRQNKAKHHSHFEYFPISHCYYSSININYYLIFLYKFRFDYSDSPSISYLLLLLSGS